MKAIGRGVRITPKKLNLIANMVRKMDAMEASEILKFTPKKAARILNKILKSAMANAENNYKQEIKSLFIKEIIVTGGATIKRSLPVSRGRSHPILKRTAHATVLLGVKEEPEKNEEDKESKVEKKSSKTSDIRTKKRTIKEKSVAEKQ